MVDPVTVTILVSSMSSLVISSITAFSQLIIHLKHFRSDCCNRNILDLSASFKDIKPTNNE